jgi:hypothetical protein
VAVDPLPHLQGDVGLVEVLEELSGAGYRTDFLVDDEGRTKCRTCGRDWAAKELQLDGLRRLEGTSDPADMSTVLALTCPGCGAQGTAVLRYGSEAGPGEATLLRELDEPRTTTLDVAEAAADGDGEPDDEA